MAQTQGSSGDSSSAIAQYKLAETDSTNQSLKVSTEITQINAPANAIKKISPN